MDLTCECAAVLQVKLESVCVKKNTEQNLDFHQPHQPRGELAINEKIKFQCSIRNSKIDWALLSEGQNIVLAVIEAKSTDRKRRRKFSKTLQGFEENNVRQLACYVLGAPAYFLWGILKRTDPIVALLIYPDFLLCLTFRKPADIKAHLFGIHLTIEGTEKRNMMFKVLKHFLRKCLELYFNPEVKAMDANIAADKRILVHPSSWSSVNVNLEDGLEQYKESHNLGFLFRTNESNLRRLLGHALNVGGIRIPDTKIMIVKCLSAFLDVNHFGRYSAVLRVLEKVQEAELRLEAQRRELEAQRRELEAQRRELEAQRREAELRQFIRKHFGNSVHEYCGGSAAIGCAEEIVNRAPCETRALEIFETGGGEIVKTGVDGNFQSQAMALQPSNATPGEEVGPGIKTPYLFCCDMHNHGLIIMEDMGLNLAEWLSLKTAELKEIWSDSSNRKAFYEDVVLTLLYLADKHSLSHNDIRMANIALGMNKRFCTLDFDMSDIIVSRNAGNSALLLNIACSKTKIFVFTILQLSSVIFELDRVVSNLDTKVVKVISRKVSTELLNWVHKSKIMAFQSWLLSKQDGLQDMLLCAGKWDYSVGSEVGYFQQIMMSRLKL